MCPGEGGSRTGGGTTAVGDRCPGSFVAGVGGRADVWGGGVCYGTGLTACCCRERCSAGGGALCPSRVIGGTGFTREALTFQTGLVRGAGELFGLFDDTIEATVFDSFGEFCVTGVLGVPGAWSTFVVGAVLVGTGAVTVLRALDTSLDGRVTVWEGCGAFCVGGTSLHLHT